MRSEATHLASFRTSPRALHTVLCNSDLILRKQMMCQHREESSGNLFSHGPPTFHHSTNYRWMKSSFVCFFGCVKSGCVSGASLFENAAQCISRHERCISAETLSHVCSSSFSAPFQTLTIVLKSGKRAWCFWPLNPSHCDMKHCAYTFFSWWRLYVLVVCGLWFNYVIFRFHSCCPCCCWEFM